MYHGTQNLCKARTLETAAPWLSRKEPFSFVRTYTVFQLLANADICAAYCQSLNTTGSCRNQVRLAFISRHVKHELKRLYVGRTPDRPR